MNESRKPEVSTRKKITMGAAGAVGALLLLAAAQKPNSEPDRVQTADELQACIPSEETQVFEFTSDTPGKNSAIHSIEGSGAGETDSCWSEAESIVDEALRVHGDAVPSIGETIVIPRSIEPRQ